MLKYFLHFQFNVQSIDSSEKCKLIVENCLLILIEELLNELIVKAIVDLTDGGK